MCHMYYYNNKCITDCFLSSDAPIHCHIFILDCCALVFVVMYVRKVLIIILSEQLMHIFIVIQ